MDHHQSLAIRLVEIIMVIEMEVFGKGNVQVLCIRAMSRLFTNLPLNFPISLTLTL